MTFDECCKAILSDSKTNAYVRAYAAAGIGMEGEERRVQALYILNNMQSWRGEKATEVRTALKVFGKVKV